MHVRLVAASPTPPLTIIDTMFLWQAIEKVVKDKVAQYADPMNTLQLDYGSSKGKAFTVEEDRFLICKMADLGYGNWDQLQVRACLGLCALAR